MKTYKGSLLDAFADAQTGCWFSYWGSECLPFDVYVRYRKGDITIANIHGRITKKQRGGRMPIILGILEKAYDNVIIECVQNAHLVDYLIKRGYHKDRSITEGAPTFMLLAQKTIGT